MAPAAVGAIGWLVADALLGIDLQTGSTAHPTAVTFPATVVVSLLAAAAGLGLHRLLRNRSHPDRTWTVVAGVVLAVSLLGPLRAAADGASAADISRRLFLSESTVRNYLSSAIGKTGTRNRMEAVLAAQDNGWL